MTAAHVHADALAHRFGAVTALDGVDLIAQGGVLVVLGPNGAGKSTLLRVLATVIAPDSGVVRVDGLDPRREAERIEIRRRLGYLPQELGFDDRMRVFDAVDYVAVLKLLGDERWRRRHVFDLLERVGLRDRVGDRVGMLSAGMRRRLAVAQALLGAPGLLVLDEPAAGLDPDERLRLRELLAERRQATTIVVSTHLTDEAAVSDSVIVLHSGRVRFVGSPTRLADVASGRTWVQDGFAPPDVRASWQLPDGRRRCLGTPPPGSEPVAPTIEDGYLLVCSEPDRR